MFNNKITEPYFTTFSSRTAFDKTIRCNTRYFPKNRLLCISFYTDKYYMFDKNFMLGEGSDFKSIIDSIMTFYVAEHIAFENNFYGHTPKL